MYTWDTLAIAGFEHRPVPNAFHAADSFYDPGLLTAIGETPTHRFAIIEGANHGMNVNDDVFQSLRALEQVLRAAVNFLNGLNGF